MGFIFMPVFKWDFFVCILYDHVYTPKSFPYSRREANGSTDSFKATVCERRIRSGGADNESEGNFGLY